MEFINKYKKELTPYQKKILNKTNLNYKNNYLIYLKKYASPKPNNYKGFMYLIEFIQTNKVGIDILDNLNYKQKIKAIEYIKNKHPIELAFNINNFIANYLI